MKILITGAKGFIGKNLWTHLEERGHEIIPIDRKSSMESIKNALSKADALVHLAGENRPKSELHFEKVNVGFTDKLCKLVSNYPNVKTFLFASSTKIYGTSKYGLSKRRAEKILEGLAKEMSIYIGIYRLPNIFGKWSKPNYNSVVATFCHNIINEIPIQIDNGDTNLSLVYIDDLVNSFVESLENPSLDRLDFLDIEKIYNLTVNQLANKLKSYKQKSLAPHLGSVAVGLDRALYATYLSFMTPKNFSSPLEINADQRGVFVEILKTNASGQFSFFTLNTDQKRGGHYHHTKNEKFVIIKGSAFFKFKNIATKEIYSLTVYETDPKIVTTIPGWVHEISNVGSSEVVGVVWANEVFDPCSADTIGAEI